MEPINKRGVVDFLYMAGLNGQRIALYAPSLYAAKQKAIEHIKPKKKDRGLLWVRLIQEHSDGHES